MPLPFGSGPTYTELKAVRAAHYARRGPDLVSDTILNIDALGNAENVTQAQEAIVELNELSLELGTLEPAWFPFSVACFQGMLSFIYCGCPSVYTGIKQAFDETIQALSPAHA